MAARRESDDERTNLDVESAFGLQVSQEGVHAKVSQSVRMMMMMMMMWMDGSRRKRGDRVAEVDEEVIGIGIGIGPRAGVLVFVEGALEERFGGVGVRTGEGDGDGADDGQTRLGGLGALVMDEEGGRCSRWCGFAVVGQ
jgi:hypothetical protein